MPKQPWVYERHTSHLAWTDSGEDGGLKLSDIAVDIKAQEEGEWKEHPQFDGVEVLVKSIHSEAFRKRRALLMNRLPRRTRKIGDAVMAQEDLDREALSACIGDLKGVEAEGGEAIEYNDDLMRQWSKDPIYRVFFDGVRELADEIGSADAEAIEESVGN